MIYLIIVLMLIIIFTMYSADKSSKVNEYFPYIFVIAGYTLLLTIYLYSESDMVANKVLKKYEMGDYQKKYTIIGEDSTYKWISKPLSK